MTKEKWIHLTYADLAECLAQDEIDKLNSISLSADIQDVCQRQLDSVAATYRGSFQAKGYSIDKRANYLPNSYKMYALALARYFICTRFPNSKDIFLDEPRSELFKKAQELVESPSIGVPEPDYSDDPVLSADPNTYYDPAIKLPFQRILPMIGRNGFTSPYTDGSYQISGMYWL